MKPIFTRWASIGMNGMKLASLRGKYDLSDMCYLRGVTFQRCYNF
jgi:hypothetical protein